MKRHIEIKAAFIVCAVIIIAVGCHSIARRTENDVIRITLDFLRTFLYIGLFAAWGVSINRRVIHPRVKKYIMAVAALMIFWLVLREVKFRFVLNADVIRYMWYAYYIPILLIPLIALTVSILSGMAKRNKIAGLINILCIFTFALIALVLTNDIHELVFSFPDGIEVKSEYVDYKYGVGFFIIVAWGIACSISALVIMMTSARYKNAKRFLWLPLLPFIADVVYIALYAVRVPSAIMAEIDDIAVFNCLVFAGFFECCIQCGLIQSNVSYSDLFGSLGDLWAQICDEKYKVEYSAGSKSIDMASAKKAEKGAYITDDGKRIYNMPITGGRVVWAEDVSELLELKGTLEERQEELRERNALLQYEYDKEKEHKTVLEQNRLYELMEKKTESQLEKIDELIDKYETSDDIEQKRRIISYIIVLGSYIKRSKDFILTLDSTRSDYQSKLDVAFAESYRALKNLGINGAAFIDAESGDLSYGRAAEAYDFFEDVTEAVYSSAKYINASVSKVRGKWRITVSTDTNVNSDELLKKYKGILLDKDDEDTVLVFDLDGGETT